MSISKKGGERKRQGDVLLTVESVKSAEDVFSPVTGEIIEVNESLGKSPELLNKDSYANWLVKMRLEKGGFKPQGMSASEYRKFIGEE